MSQYTMQDIQNAYAKGFARAAARAGWDEPEATADKPVYLLDMAVDLTDLATREPEVGVYTQDECCVMRDGKVISRTEIVDRLNSQAAVTDKMAETAFNKLDELGYDMTRNGLSVDDLRAALEAAFEQGKAARLKGLGISDNLYLSNDSPAPSATAFEWQRGYENAADASPAVGGAMPEYRLENHPAHGIIVRHSGGQVFIPAKGYQEYLRLAGRAPVLANPQSMTLEQASELTMKRYDGTFRKLAEIEAAEGTSPEGSGSGKAGIEYWSDEIAAELMLGLESFTVRTVDGYENLGTVLKPVLERLFATTQPLTSESGPSGQDEIKAAYVAHFGSDVGWLGANGSWFIEGFNVGSKKSEVATLRSQIAGMEKDSARLDFLHIMTANKKTGWRIEFAPAGNLCVSLVGLGGTTIREAIDAAIGPTSTQASPLSDQEKLQ